MCVPGSTVYKYIYIYKAQHTQCNICCMQQNFFSSYVVQLFPATFACPFNYKIILYLGLVLLDLHISVIHVYTVLLQRAVEYGSDGRKRVYIHVDQAKD